MSSSHTLELKVETTQVHKSCHNFKSFAVFRTLSKVKLSDLKYLKLCQKVQLLYLKFKKKFKSLNIGGYACSRLESYLSLCLCTILISLWEHWKVLTCFTLFDYTLRFHHLKSTCNKSYTRSDCLITLVLHRGTSVTATSSTSSKRDHRPHNQPNIISANIGMVILALFSTQNAISIKCDLSFPAKMHSS